MEILGIVIYSIIVFGLVVFIMWLDGHFASGVGVPISKIKIPCPPMKPPRVGDDSARRGLTAEEIWIALQRMGVSEEEVFEIIKQIESEKQLKER
jgi:hypothetical protein